VNLLKFLLILRARYQISILVMLLAVAAGITANELIPKRYTAETVVMVDMRSPDPVAGLLMPAMIAPMSLGTQLDIINSDRVGRKVVRMLRLDEDPAVREIWRNATGGKGKLEDWMSSLLRRGLKVTPSRDSHVLALSYQGSDPAFVTAVANAFAQAYIEASVELKVEPARQYSQWFADQAKVLRENVEKAQARLSAVQRDKGIVVTDETLDYEHAKLRELATGLTAVQAQIRDAQSKQRTASGGVDTLPEVMQNSVVLGLRTSINQLEVKLKEAAGNLGVKHPQYRRMESELAELKLRLTAETKHAASGFSSSGAVGRVKEAELKAALDAQTKKLLNMKKERDEISVLVRDVETAKRAYEAVTNRLTQTSLESQATRTNVSVLTPAIEPIAPTYPMPLEKTLLISVAFGMLLAGAAAVGLEFFDRRIRMPDDLAEMLQVPVLAVVPPCRLPPTLRLAFKGAAAALPKR
jgi:succinoglycan biosynthesis transport protein ExoP